MISLAGRDILHGWSKYVLTGLGLGLLIGVTLTMAGVYRGMVDDAHALLTNSRADLWVVQKDTQGPYAESSSIKDDVVRSVRGMPGVAAAANVAYLTMQVQKGGQDSRVMVVGMEPGMPGAPGYLVAGRHITRNHYEAVADVKTGFALGDVVRIRRHDYTVVGLTRRMVSSICAWLDTTPVSRTSPLVVITVMSSPAKPVSLFSADLTWVVTSASETLAIALAVGA